MHDLISGDTMDIKKSPMENSAAEWKDNFEKLENYVDGKCVNVSYK